MNDSPIAIVLAAGKGTRMKSDLPKVLFPVLGRPMIDWVLDALASAGIHQSLVVVGYRADDVKAALQHRSGISFAVQAQQLGTGHAVQMCHSQLTDRSGPVAVIAGDSPLIQASSLQRLFSEFVQGQFACLLGTLIKENPAGLGRIVRDSQGKFSRIVEHKDADARELEIKEVNMSTYIFDAQKLLLALGKLNNANAQGEFYLTDCPAILLKEGFKVDASPVLEPCESLSINTIDELAAAEAQMRQLGYASA